MAGMVSGGNGQTTGGNGQTTGGNGQTTGGNGQTTGGNGQTTGGNGQTTGGNGQTTGGNGQTTGGNGQTTGHGPQTLLAAKHATVMGPGIGARKSLDFKIEKQEQPEWCWAAVAVSVERYFDPDSELTQCELVTKVLRKDKDLLKTGFKIPKSDSPCCSEQGCCFDPDQCNYPAELETALKEIHKWRNTLDQLEAPDGSLLSTGTLTFEQVRREIDHGRPVCADITWGSGGGHSVVIRGYRLLSTGACQLEVADPLNPSAVVDFVEFSKAYYGDGEWTETDLVQKDWE
jgi:hypothetical protein